MKALFFGLGSVGQRHLRNLKMLRPEYELYAVRSGNTNVLIEGGAATEVPSLAEHYGFTELKFNEAVEAGVDVAFVCGPSSTHFEITSKLLPQGISCFVEKPATVAVYELKTLQLLAENSQSQVMVGLQTRWNPIYEEAKAYIAQASDKIVSVSAEWGTYLPAHHPYEDYRLGYAARKELGGGVNLCLIHELDMLTDFFGVPKSYTAISGNFSDLEMSAEDTVHALMKYERYCASLMLSFAQTKETRCLKVVFTDSTLVLDLGLNCLRIYGIDGKQLVESPGTDRDQWFIDEMREFVEHHEQQKQMSPNLLEVEAALVLAEAFRESGSTGSAWHEFST